MLRGVMSNRISWSGTRRAPPVDVPPYVNNTPAGPRSATCATCTRSFTRTRRMRSRSASNRSGALAFGHHGPSFSMASVNGTLPTPPPSTGSRETCAPDTGSTMNAQFSPLGHGANVVARSGGFGPYVVHGPDPDRGLFGSSVGGSGSPKYWNWRLTTLSTTGRSGG